MRKIFGGLVVLCAAGLVACGDKGADEGGGGGGGGKTAPAGGGATKPADSGAAKGAGPVGTWELDSNAFWEANKAMVLEQAKAGFAQAEEGLKQLADLPADQKEAAKKMMMEQVPAEHRPILEAFLRSPAEANVEIEKMAKKQFSAIKATVEFKADKTYVGNMEMGENKETRTGTWAQSGDQVTITHKTKDGKPVEGEDAKSWTLTQKGNTMSGKPEEQGPTIFLKRK